MSVGSRVDKTESSLSFFTQLLPLLLMSIMPLSHGCPETCAVISICTIQLVATKKQQEQKSWSEITGPVICSQEAMMAGCLHGL